MLFMILRYQSHHRFNRPFVTFGIKSSEGRTTRRSEVLPHPPQEHLDQLPLYLREFLVPGAHLELECLEKTSSQMDYRNNVYPKVKVLRSQSLQFIHRGTTMSIQSNHLRRRHWTWTTEKKRNVE